MTIKHCNKCHRGRMIKASVKTFKGRKTIWFCGFCGAEGRLPK